LKAIADEKNNPNKLAKTSSSKFANQKQEECAICKVPRTQFQRGAACEICVKALRTKTGHQCISKCLDDKDLLEEVLKLSQEARQKPGTKRAKPRDRESNGDSESPRLKRVESMLEMLFAHFKLEVPGLDVD
jgi:hypothetical protein